MELIFVLDNIRSTHNVGSILRTADGIGVSRVIFSGYTPRVNDERVLPHLREKLNKQIKKTSLGAEEYVENYACDDIKAELLRLNDEGYLIVGLENNIKDSRLVKITELRRILQGSKEKFGEKWSEVSSALRSKVVLILGEEVHGINYSLYDIIDLFLEIPMEGRKESFNVSVAAGIAGFYLKNL